MHFNLFWIATASNTRMHYYIAKLLISGILYRSSINLYFNCTKFIFNKIVYNLHFRYMIESPRWLINRGRLHRAAYYLNRIAKINKKPVKVTAKMLQSMLPNEEPEKVYGMLSLFSGLRLAKNTIMLLMAW